jgi:uncharacterized protein YidB (DUF937 family)
MRTVGACKNALELMCKRAVSRNTRDGKLADLQMVQADIADSWIALESFRLMVLRTAWLIDKHQDYQLVRKDIAAIKVMMPKVYNDIARHPHVGACIRRRKGAVKALQFGLDRGQARSRVAAAVTPSVAAGEADVDAADGVVLDPFLGSGTTAFAAHLEFRDFIGIEVHEAGVGALLRRIGEGGLGNAARNFFGSGNTATTDAGNANNAALADDKADPDHDGMANLLEYALNTDPNLPSPAAAPIVSHANISGTEYLTLTYLKDTSKTDITYQAQVSGTLSTGSWGNISDDLIGTNGSIETHRAKIALGTGQQFLRLQVTRP